MNRSNKTDWKVKRVARYLKHTAEYNGILRIGDATKKRNGLIGYADANWAESRKNRKSVSRYVIQYCDSTVSITEACVALSSTEAECMALCEASRNIMNCETPRRL